MPVMDFFAAKLQNAVRIQNVLKMKNISFHLNSITGVHDIC